MAMLLIYAVGADQECDLFAQIAPHVAADEGGNLATLLSRALKSGIDARNRVAFWEGEAGTLQSYSHPKEEFVDVLDLNDFVEIAQAFADSDFRVQRRP